MIKEGLRVALNQIRETSIKDNTLYHQYIDEIMPDTDIGVFGAPLLSMPNLMNEFISVLAQRIAYTSVTKKLFKNPLNVLEGESIPLGSIGQEIFINPAKGRKFNVDDFAGLLAKYEADVKIQYHHLNSDIQYPVTITRSKLRDAFTSWDKLEEFINGITQSLYNGAYIDRYNMTKNLVSNAYAGNNVQIEVVDDLTTEAKAKTFLTKARTLFLNMQAPSSKYNAWRKVGGYGRDVLTWTDPEDIVFLIRNDIGGYLDVNVLASAFNIDKAKLLGNVIYVNDFDEFDSDGNKIYDGSKILGIMCDKAWFRIKAQEMTMDEFYNANNKTWQMYLNDVRMYSYSLFANAVVFATEEPEVDITKIEFEKNTLTLDANASENIKLIVTPTQANNPTITYSSSDTDVATFTKVNDREITVTAVGPGSATIRATCGNLTDTINLTVTESEE